MKKITSILLIFVLCLGLTMMTGCGDGNKEVKSPYADITLSEYITLPDYSTFTVEGTVTPVISDAEVDAKIQKILESYATEETVKEGVVEKGDYLVIDFAGTLEDGTTDDGMVAAEYTLGPIGNAGFIDGFEEGLIGVSVGETVSLDLQFPDPYPTKEEFSGMGVTFEVTVRSKKVEVVPELNEEFVKENSDVNTIEEYRSYVKAQLEAEDLEAQLYDLKRELYAKIVDETELLEYPDGRVADREKVLRADYEAMANSYGYQNWDEFRDAYFQMDQSEFDEQLKLYAESMVKSEMVIYAVAEKEDIALTESEYEEELQNMLEAAGFKDAAEFQSYAGMTIREYADQYDMDQDIILTKWLDVVYERLLKQA